MDGPQEKAGPIEPQQCGGGNEDAATSAAPAAADATGGDLSGSVASVLGLPECIISEILGNLGVNDLGRVSCTSRQLRDACADEYLWDSLWEGPLPDGFDFGGKTAHAALWLLVKGRVEQTRLAVSKHARATSSTTASSAHGRRGPRRRRVGNLTASIMGGGFPVHVSFIAIRGRTVATAAGPEIAVWDLEEAVPRAQFNVSGHGSVTCLLLDGGTLLAGDNSGYLRSYTIDGIKEQPLHEIRAHVDRVTAIDVYALPLPEESASSQQRGVGASALGHSTEAPSERPDSVPFWVSGSSGGGGGGGGGGGVSRRLFGWGTRNTDVDALDEIGARSRRWDQAHGLGDGWAVEGGEPEGYEDDAAAMLMPSGTRAASYPLLHAAVGDSVGRGRGRGRGAQSYALGNVSGGSYGYIGSTGGLSGELNCRIGSGGGSGGGSFPGWTEMVDGAPERLGKRQGYAGRGQGEDPRQIDACDDEEKGGEERKENVGWKQGKSLLRAVRLAGVGTCRGGRSHKGKREGWQEGKRERQRSVLFTGSDDGTAKAWDAESGQFLCIYAGHTRGVICLQATLTESYGPVLVTGGGDSAVIIWELTTGRCLERLETGAGLAGNPNGPGPRIGCLQAFSDRIVFGEDRHVSVWSLSKGKSPTLARRSFCKHQRPIRRLAVVGPWIVTCSGDCVIRFWDSRTGLCVRQLGTKSGAAITTFRLSGLCLLTTSLFDSSFLMTQFLPPL